MGLKKLIATYLDLEGSVAYEYYGGNDEDLEIADATPLFFNGSYDSPECEEYLEGCDIIVTNPPFSLTSEYIPYILSKNKQIYIMNYLANIGIKNIVENFYLGKIWLDKSVRSNKIAFNRSDGSIAEVGSICWFTNIENDIRKQVYEYTETYSPDKYPKYDNFDAIDVDEVIRIPKDYDGVMGVPISFFKWYNPNQLEILGYINCSGEHCFNRKVTLNGKQVFSKFIVKHKRLV